MMVEVSFKEGQVPAVFGGMCPNCGGDITSDRLWQGFLCKRCITDEEFEKHKEEILNAKSVVDILKVLERIDRSRIRKLKELVDIEQKVSKFREFFKTAVGFEPWSLQVSWARRVISGQSFVALAPTGVGKTTFGLTTALFLDGKSYIILPTRLLSRMLYERLLKIQERTGKHKRIFIADPSFISKKMIDEFLERHPELKDQIYSAKRVKRKDGSEVEKLVANPSRALKLMIEHEDWDILITTSMFLAKNEEIILKKRFDFIFVDDVDSYLKQPKNVERVLKIMGLSDEDMTELKRAIFERAKIFREARGNLSEEQGELLEKISDTIARIRRKVKGVLVVSSATAKPKASTVRYFREIFGFEISPSTSSLRNIEDCIVKVEGDTKKLFEVAYKIISTCGGGCFAYINAELGKEKVDDFVAFLNEKGVSAISYEKFGDKEQELFKSGQIDVVVGISSLRNPLTRGIDLPSAVRYAVLVGVPRFVFSMGELESIPQILSALLTLKDALGERKRVFSYIESLRKWIGMREEDIERYPAIKNKIEEIKRWLSEKLESEDVKRAIEESDDIPLRSGDDGFKIVVSDFPAYIQATGRTSRLWVGGLSKGLSVMLVDDMKAFNQLKKRAKFELLDIEFKEIKFDGDEISEESKKFLEDVLRKVDDDRRKIREIEKGNILSSKIDVKPPRSIAFIVESPNKAGTISKLIGRPTRRKIMVNGYAFDVWEVSKGDTTISIIATGGHIFDLPVEERQSANEKESNKVNGKAEFEEGEQETQVEQSVESPKQLELFALAQKEKEKEKEGESAGTQVGSLAREGERWGVFYYRKNGELIFEPYYKAIKRCRKCGENFFEDSRCPRCGSDNIEDKNLLIQAIRKVAEEVDEVFVATDPDHEGEKISWDVYLSVNMPGKTIRRAEYHEVTRKAILNALENPRDINLALVKSQIVRRIADRWVGFSMSEFLQKEKDIAWLSGGRVQTPVLGWLIKREEEMKKKIGIFTLSTSVGLKLELRFDPQSDERKEIFKEIRKALRRLKKEEKKLRVKLLKVEKFEEDLRPSPPFNTAEMLKQASAQLKLSAPETMNLAQRLFEAGLITYHRTDSTHVSDVGISVAGEILRTIFGEEDAKKVFAPSHWGEVGAHECIRPTRPLLPDELSISVRLGTVSVPQKAVELYRLIFENFVASQTKPIRAKRIRAKAKLISPYSEIPEVEGEFVWTVKITDDTVDEQLLSKLRRIRFIPIFQFGHLFENQDEVELEVDLVEFKTVSPVPPYTEGTLVEEMKRRGIGRPSTWAHIIKVLKDRKYCIERGGYLFVTSLGKEVYEAIKNNEHLSHYAKEDYTRELEEKMDEVEEGKVDYQKVLNELWNKLWKFWQTFEKESKGEGERIEA